MPEGDTLWRTAAALRPLLLGGRVMRAEPTALHRLRGATVTEVRSVGKNLLIRFDHGITLRSHLRLSGSWHIYPLGQPWRPSRRPPAAVLETDGAVAVLFNAPVPELTRTGAERTQSLGPDLLDRASDLDEVLQRVRARPSQTAIGAILLDQAIAAGIGNIHRCELLWSARIDPWTPLGEISDPALRAVYNEAKRGLERGTQSRMHRHAIHGRAGRPCLRCGTLIRRRPQAVGELARITYWCPVCQVRPRQSS